MKIDLTLEELHRSENDLAGQLLALSDKHKADHEIHHVARDLAAWSQGHVREIARIGQKFDLDLDDDPAGDPTLVQKMRQEFSDRMGRRSSAALTLLRDLRQIYIDASGTSVDWELLGQAAQGVRDKELLAVVAQCHPDTLRQVRWANAMLKVNATQILVT